MGSAVEGKRPVGFYLEDFSRRLLNLHVSVPSLICPEGGDGELWGGGWCTYKLAICMRCLNIWDCLSCVCRHIGYLLHVDGNVSLMMFLSNR